MPHSAVDNALIRQLYSCAHSTLVLPPSHLVDLIPCIHAHPYKAIPQLYPQWTPETLMAPGHKDPPH
jgi:hypothetical protein